MGLNVHRAGWNPSQGPELLTGCHAAALHIPELRLSDEANSGWKWRTMAPGPGSSAPQHGS